MSSSPIFVGALVLALGGCVLVTACSGEVDSVHYGPPSGLTGKVPSSNPGDSGGGGGGVDSGGGGGVDSGGGGAVDSGGGGGVCTNGPDGGDCAVTWSGDIYPLVAGTWKCATAACHGTAGGSPPTIDPTSASTAYGQLVAYKVPTNGNKPYVNPCSTNPEESSIVCNLKASGACGSIPMPIGTPVTAGDAQKLATWVGCGSPQN